jgi:hypothetical protein
MSVNPEDYVEMRRGIAKCADKNGSCESCPLYKECMTLWNKSLNQGGTE